MTKPSAVESQPIGEFFTPLHWAKWVIAENQLFEKWVDGAVVFDPTAGEGSFLEAFVATALDRRIPVTNDMVKRLFGVEREEKFARNFFLKMKRLYGIAFPGKISGAKIIFFRRMRPKPISSWGIRHGRTSMIYRRSIRKY